MNEINDERVYANKLGEGYDVLKQYIEKAHAK